MYLTSTKQKTYQTAIVIIPPAEIQTPIQAIRRQHDRHVRRWMPHITLLYPFLPLHTFSKVLPQLISVCHTIRPFKLMLRRIHHFRHHSDHYTLWFVPEPALPLISLHNALYQIFPECDDLDRYPNGFIPHLSIDQVRGRLNMEKLIKEFQADWKTCEFVVRVVVLINRGTSPDDVFRVHHYIMLGETYDHN